MAGELSDLIQDIRHHPAATALIAILLVVTLYGNLSYTLDTAHRIDALQGNICRVIATGRKGEEGQRTFYQGRAAASLLRSKVDTGSLRQIDLDAYQADLHVVRQYDQALAFKFPGCP